jgi:hypothetical protein
MKYMPILPVGMLDVFHRTKLSSAFILPQFWNNDKYKSFYTSLSWNTIVIDNALYEQDKEVETSDLICIAESLSATRTFIAAPETIGDGQATKDDVLDCIDAYGRYGDLWELIVILQGTPKDMVEIIEAVGLDMAYAIPISQYRKGFSRSAIADYVFNKAAPNYLHALGLDNLFELLDIRWRFQSVDSSMPATAAINFINLLDTFEVKRNGLPTDPKRVDLSCEEFSDSEVLQTIHNVFMVDEMINLSGNNYLKHYPS